MFSLTLMLLPQSKLTVSEACTPIFGSIAFIAESSVGFLQPLSETLPRPS